MKYQQFLKELDSRLQSYVNNHKNYILCKRGCSCCCEKGDYPISQLELEYLMLGYAKLDNSVKQNVQANIKLMKPGMRCPFLVDNICSVYLYRPIICRVHGLAYLCKDKTVKLPHCVNNGKNYSEVFSGNTIVINPILENLDTPSVLRKFEYGEIRNLFDWLLHET